MALISSSETKRLVPEHEPESWFDVRPVTLRITRQLTPFLSTPDFNFEFIKAILVGWSYPTPVTPESILDLDYVTQKWIMDQVDLTGEPSAEKKAPTNSPSPNGSQPETTPSEQPPGPETSLT